VLGLSNSTSSFGQPVTFTATISNLSIGTTPVGSVRFLDGTRIIGSAALTSGVASFTTSTLAAGVSHSITASYLGGTPFVASVSGASALTISKARTSTALTVSQPGPIIYGQTVTLTVTVSNTDSSVVPTGVVTFLSGTTVLGRVALSGGVASLTTTKIPGGTDTLTASYGGTANFDTSTSSGVTLVVNPAGTSTQLTDLMTGPVAYGQPVTFLATVSDLDTSAVVAGVVQFVEGTKVLGTVRLNSSGQASFTTTTLARGTHTIRAIFVANTNFAGSSSNTVTQSVV
jgi:hypothetical protein